MLVANSLIIIVFEGQIRFISEENGSLVLEPFVIMCTKLTRHINKAKVHIKERVLAVAFHGFSKKTDNPTGEKPKNVSGTALNQSFPRRSQSTNIKVVPLQHQVSGDESPVRKYKVGSTDKKESEDNIKEHYHSALIEIYSLTSPPKKLFSVKTEEIELLDFSSPLIEECFLMCQDVCGKVTVFCVHKNKVSLERDEHIEWASEGILISESSKKLQSIYGPNNSIVSVLRLDDKTLAVADELGTVC